jgi:flavodoxin
MGGEVEETDGVPFCGSGGGVSASVGESGPEDVEVVEFCENTESTDDRILDDIEELE